MYEIPYSAVLYIIIKALKGEELHFENKILLKLLPFSTIIKAIPAGLTIVFVLINNNESFFLHVILGMALLFCMFGDIGMEKGLIPGLLMFLVGQILFIVAFVGQALTTEINIEPLLITAVVTLGMIVYIILFLRYLESSEKGLGEFRIPVLLYCVFLSGMFLSTFLLWMSSGVMELGIVVLGGLLFVISDSIIAIREFHHQINYSTLKVMTTYYSAIFLLSLASLIQFS
ncbi:MAG: lysoplasmalogenase [Candidatus Hodarchaeales archaeon]